MTGKFLKRKLNNAKKWLANRPYEIRRFYNKKRIKNRDFTIISNNCWAGKAYQYLDMPYLTPTVGLYFFAEDYLKFISNLHYYLSLELQFIDARQSKYSNTLAQRKQLDIPIGILDDVEIVFLHYKSKEEAKSKWNRRKERINFDNVIFKFSNMNLCNEEVMKTYDGLPFNNKFLLNNNEELTYKSEVFWLGECNEQEVLNDTNPFPGNLHLAKLLDNPAEKYPLEGLNENEYGGNK